MMRFQNTDIITATFEMASTIFQVYNIRRLFIDKGISGVHWGQTALFMVWCVWNIYYYPSLGQLFSFGAAIIMLITNTIWVWMAICYGSKNEPV